MASIPALRAAAVVGAVAVTTLVAGLPAAAADAPFATDHYVIGFQAATGTLWGAGNPFGGSLGVSMAPRTSPSVAPLPATNGSFQAVWQGANNHLWSTGPTGPIDVGVAMAPGTSPSLSELSPSGGYAITVQGGNGDLWTVTNSGAPDHALQILDSGVRMAPGTSPSTTALRNGFWETAVQAANGDLWTNGTLTNGDTGLSMAFGASPAIDGVPFSQNGGTPVSDYLIAYESNTGALSVEDGHTGSAQVVTGQAVAGGTNPSITALAR
jgi:hypothetical protein